MTNSYTKKRIRKIARRFGLRPLKSTSIASFYRENAVIRVNTDSGTFAMKPFFRNMLLRTSTVEQINTTTDYIRLLMNSGYSYMPKWLSTNSGALWILNHGRPFYITEWITGRNLEKSEDFVELGRALATLHTISTGLSQTKSSFTLKQIRLWRIQDRLFRRRMARAIQNNRRYRRWYKKYGETCNRMSDRTWTEFRDTAIVDLLEMELDHPSLIHNDITTPNVIISDNGQLFIIDWDRVKDGSIYVDLVKALMNTTQFNPEFIHSLLKGYEELKPLSLAERRLITALYGLPREAWYATRFPNRRRNSEMLDILDQSWLLRLKAIDLMDEWTKSIEGSDN